MKLTTRNLLNVLLYAGILLRLVVLIAASPFDRDGHLEVIQYIAQHAALPVSNLTSQSYHPPLYYLLMAPVYAFWPASTPIHFFSFVFSVANLWLIRRLMDRPLVARDSGFRLVAFAMVCFLPQVVMFGSFISNDTLAMLVGTAVFAAAVGYIERPAWRARYLFAALIGVGLLTKGTFLLVGPAAAPVVLIAERRNGWGKAIKTAAIFCAIWSVVGCYKYVDNYARAGNPLINNLDVDSQFKREQSGTWKGWRSIYDINIIKLVRRPVLQKDNVFSYPLLMYGTFWYPHIPESSFDGNICGYQWVGSLLYSVAIVPTMIFLAGFVRATLMTGVVIFQQVPQGREKTCLISFAALAIVLANVAVVLSAGIKYDIWSCFQARLCFPSLVPMITLFGLGVEWISRSRLMRWLALSFCWATAAAALLYFCIELSLTYGWLPRLKPPAYQSDWPAISIAASPVRTKVAFHLHSAATVFDRDST